MASSRFTLNVGAMGRISHGMVRPVLEGAATLLRDEIVLTMDPGPARTGETYRVPGTDTEYTASAPGEPPAVRGGLYRDSWKRAPTVTRGRLEIAVVYSDRRVNGYLLGLLLELGTLQMGPRPHIRPAIDNVRPKVQALVNRAAL